MAQQAATVSIGATDIGGVVRGPNGPEPGVWVIAETTDLPTRMSKTVVTDDQGRYVIPDLPKFVPKRCIGRGNDSSVAVGKQILERVQAETRGVSPRSDVPAL